MSRRRRRSSTMELDSLPVESISVRDITYWIGPVLVCLVLSGGIFSYGYAQYNTARAVGWIGCALLGIWATAFWAWDRFDFKSFPLVRWLMLFFIATLAWAGLQLIPIRAGWASALSPFWRETLDAMKQSGYEIPSKVPLASAPESAWRSWNQMLASLLFFWGACVAASRMRGFITLAVLVVGFSVVESLIGGLVLMLSSTHRAHGIMFNSNHHAAVIVMGLPILFWWVTRRKTTDEFGLTNTESTDRALMLGGIATVAALGWLLALSRGSLAAVLFVACLDLMSRIKPIARLLGGEEDTEKKRSSRGLLGTGWIMALLIASALILVISSQAVQELAERFEASGGIELSARTAYWWATLKGLMVTPFMGLGLGGAEFAINRFLVDRSTSTVAVWSHNDYVQIVSELGLIWTVGALCFSFAFLRLMRRHWLETAKSLGRRSRGFRRAALLGIAITLAHSFVDFPLRTPMVGFQFLALCALLLTGNRVLGSR